VRTYQVEELFESRALKRDLFAFLAMEAEPPDGALRLNQQRSVSALLPVRRRRFSPSLLLAGGGASERGERAGRASGASEWASGALGVVAIDRSAIARSGSGASDARLEGGGWWWSVGSWTRRGGKRFGMVWYLARVGSVSSFVYRARRSSRRQRSDLRGGGRTSGRQSRAEDQSPLHRMIL
jgi:hypothetical protein